MTSNPFALDAFASVLDMPPAQPPGFDVPPKLGPIVSRAMRGRIRALEHEVKSHPNFARWKHHNELRHLYFQAGDFERSLYHVNIMLAQRPRDRYTMDVLGNWKLSLYPALAFQNLLRAARKYLPGHSLRASCLLEAGEICEAHGHLPEARRLYQAVLTVAMSAAKHANGHPCREAALARLRAIENTDRARVALTPHQPTPTEEAHFLRQAILSGDVEQVEAMAGLGADVNFGTLELPLHTALQSGQTEIVQFLLGQGADPNTPRNSDLKTALMLISWSGRVHRLRHDPDRFAPGPEAAGWAEEQDLAMVRALLAAGAQSDARSQDGTSALHFAAGFSSPRIVQALLEAGAPVDARDNFKRSPLHFVLHQGRRSRLWPRLWKTMADALMSYGTLEPGSNAVEAERLRDDGEEDASIVQTLLQAGAEVGARDGRGETPLHLAAATAAPWSVRLLLRRGVDLGALNAEAQTPLQRLLSQGRCSSLMRGCGLEPSDVEELLGDLLVVARSGGSSAEILPNAVPLLRAAADEDLAVLKLLLEAGAVAPKAE